MVWRPLPYAIYMYRTVTIDDLFPVHRCSQIMAACPVLPSLKQSSPANSLWATLHSLLSMTTASGRAHSTLLVEPSRRSSTDSRRWSLLVPLEGKGWSLWGQVTVIWLERRLERRMRAKGKMRVRKVWLFASVLYAKLYTYMYMHVHEQCMQFKHTYYEKRDHLGKMMVVTVWNLWQYPVNIQQATYMYMYMCMYYTQEVPDFPFLTAGYMLCFLVDWCMYLHVHVALMQCI